MAPASEGAGNRIDRKPRSKKPKAKPADPASTLAAQALARADQIADVQSSVITKLKTSFGHLNKLLTNYEAGYAGYIDTMKKADSAQALRSSLADTVMGLYVGALTAVVGPGAALAKRLGTSVVTKWSTAVSRSRESVRAALRRMRRVKAATKRGAALLEGLVDESFEAAAASTLSSSGKGVAASAGRGGKSVLGRFKQVVGQMSQLVNDLPDLMPLLKSQTALAGRVVQILKGTKDPDLLAAVTALDTGSTSVTAEIQKLAGPFDAVVERVQAKPVDSPREIERQLWTTWVANLDGDHDKLNHTEIRERFRSIGLGHLFARTVGPMTGTYSGERITKKDSRRIQTNAKVAWLNARGVAVDVKTENGYSAAKGIEAYFRMAQLAERYGNEARRGTRGTSAGGKWVKIGGKTYPVFGRIPPAAEPGTPIVVDGHHPSMNHIRASAAAYMKDGTRDHLWISVTKKGDVNIHGLIVKWKIYRDMEPFRY